MKHQNIALFVAHVGCPLQCTFCNQNIIVGDHPTCTPEDVHDAIRVAKEHGAKGAQLAFFGGSFTGVPRDYMVSLLEAVQPYIPEVVSGIRISTRPDYISKDILDLLKAYHVEAIELGAQSMDNEVLAANRRGHTAEDVRTAAALIKAEGLELGLQMMTGLYKDTDDGAKRTLEELLALHPATLRIYPTVVLPKTELATLYASGAYTPETLETAVPLCADLLLRCHEAGVPVIRLGLHSGGGVEDEYLAGAYHPALRELCENRIYLKKALALLEGTAPGPVTLLVHPSEISKMAGQRRQNILQLEQYGYPVRIRPDDTLSKYEVKVTT